MSPKRLTRDRLFLLKPGFKDPSFPGKNFYCWHCALIEGVISAFPDLAQKLDIERTPWERPRESVMALVGQYHQSLPLLILAEGAQSKFQTGEVNGLVLIDEKDKILAALAERHGFPEPHP